MQDFKHYSSVRPLHGTHKALFAKPQPQALNRPTLQPTEAKDDSKAQILSESKHQVLDVKQSTSSLSSSPSDPDNLKNINSVPQNYSSTDELTTKAADLSVDVFPPWDIQSIQDGLGGRYDRDTIVDMLQKCRGDIDRAFAALLGENNDGLSDKPSIPGPPFKPSLQASRESSPFSTGSKRSADDSDDSEEQPPTARRGRPKKRLVSNLTLGVGISFRDDQNEVVSLNLRMKADAEKAKRAEKAQANPAQDTAVPEQPKAVINKAPRRSGRLSKPRPA